MKIFAVLCISLLVCTTLGQDCTNGSIVAVSSQNVDDLEFGSFPPDSAIPTDDYNPGAIGPWYDISAGIINVARPGSVSEEVIVPLLRELNINLTSFDSVELSEEQLQDLGQDLARWWAGIIALTILGGVLAIGLLICCCCFGLCRCCGQCGGGLKQQESGSINCLTIVFTIILVLLICWLIAGIVLAFFSGQQVFESVNEFEGAVDNTFDLSEIFINDSVAKIETLLCSVEDTFDLTVGQANALIGDARDVVNRFSGNIYDIVDQAISVANDIEAIQGTLTSINSSVNSLQANTTAINASLQTIAVAVGDAFDNCTVLSMTPGVTLDCEPLNPATYESGLNANYFEVPDINSELSNVQDIVRGVNLTDTALEGNATFNSAIQQITNLTQDIDRVIEDGLDQLREVTSSANGIVQNFTRQAVGRDGYIDDARDTAKSGFDFVRQYETPRYAVGVVISCLAIVVVVLVLLGVCCGMIGFRTDRAPFERTDISNCGGITLICAAFAAFFIGFFILLLSALVFFAGGVSTKFCEDLAPPEYRFFAETVDNTAVTNGEYLLSDSLFSDGSIPLTVSGILSDCSENATVYQALKLENLDFIKDIQNFTNISRLIPEVALNVSSLTDSITDVFDIDTFVPSDLQNRLDDFTSAGVNTINITQFRQQLDRNILAFNVSQQISQLESLRTNLQSITFVLPAMAAQEAQRDNIVGNINTTIAELMSIDNSVNSLGSIVGTLDSNVQMLEANGESLTNSAGTLLTNINATFNDLINTGVTPLVDNASTVFPRAIGYAQQFVDFGLNALQNEVGNCRPISAIYGEFYDSFCSFTVDGLNGFWLSLGMCGVLMIPIIIFAVITSHCYRRMKFTDGEELPYDDSFPMKTY